MRTDSHTTTRPASPVPGMRLPPVARSAGGAQWQVTDRANGFHVSREADDGRTETLNNEVGKIRIFRKRMLAEQACAAANFDVTATRLKAEPLLGGQAGAA
jgi:hypothetical protein